MHVRSLKGSRTYEGQPKKFSELLRITPHLSNCFVVWKVSVGAGTDSRTLVQEQVLYLGSVKPAVPSPRMPLS